MLTTDMMLAAMTPQAAALLNVGTGAVAALAAVVVLGVAAVLGAARELRDADRARCATA